MSNGINNPKISRISLLCLMAILIAPAIHAGDEDMSPNAYHIFDPETGYMITVESQPDSQQNQPSSDAQGNLTAASSENATIAPARLQSGIYLLVLMLLIGGIVAWSRSRNAGGALR